MSRSRKALITAGFSYGQTAMGIAVAVFVTRFLLHRLGESLYGLWLASGALLGYAALADLGIFGVLPWLVAEADGKKDVPALRGLLLHGLVVGALVGVGYVVVALLLWAAFPSVLHISAADREQLFGPLVVMVLATLVSYPLRVFVAVCVGLQDAAFTGVLSVAQLLVSNVLIVALTYKGFGLYGVAAGAAVPPLLMGVAAFIRTVSRRRELLRDWPPLDWNTARPILSGGMGAWMGSMGWQLAFASDSVVIGYLGRRDLIATFAMTTRLGQLMMQTAWTLPDSALVGLAQLNAEGLKDRVREIVLAIVRFHVLAAGGVACLVLVANPGFVRLWVGQPLFGGFLLNAIFAADILMLSFVHAIVTSCAVLGNRAKVGMAALVNGVLHGLIAIPLGSMLGLSGIAIATFLSALLTALPTALHWIRGAARISVRDLMRELVQKWGVRALPMMALAGYLGAKTAQSGPVVLVASSIAVGAMYVTLNRRLLRDLPLGLRVRRLLGAFRLV